MARVFHARFMFLIVVVALLAGGCSFIGPDKATGPTIPDASEVGDINGNGVQNEIADAVMLSSYYTIGTDAFGDKVDNAVSQSDINRNGTALEVGDFVYLVRTIVGDFAPNNPASSGQFEVRTHMYGDQLNLQYSATQDIGAVLLVFDIEPGSFYGTPALDNDMDMIFAGNGNQLKIFIFNIGTEYLSDGSGDLLSINTGGARCSLSHVEACNYFGFNIPASISAPPLTFDLGQNYPNPFTYSTTIPITLAEEADWLIVISDVHGVAVKHYAGHDQAGIVTIEWDGANDAGEDLDAGVYFYRLTIGDQSVTKYLMYAG